MAIGDIHFEPRVSFADPTTGREVIRITDMHTHCRQPYFYCIKFSQDSGRALYVSDRTGLDCAYLLDLESGESVQLTDMPDLNWPLISLDADGRFLYYTAGQELHRVSIPALEDETLFVQEPPYDGKAVYPGYSDDYTCALLAQIHRDDVVRSESGWDAFGPQCRKRPRCRLVMLDFESRDTRLVLQEDHRWLGHPQIRPGDKNTLMYCHEGPCHLLDARIWLIDADGTNKRCPGHMEPEAGAGVGYAVTHEYFTPDGNGIAFVMYPGDGDGRNSVRVFDVETFEETEYGRVHNYCHVCHSPDGRFIIGDEHHRNNWSNDCIWRLDTETGREERLCVHGASFRRRGTGTQDSHPHPGFSLDGKLAIFTTDRETSPGANSSVYLIPSPLED